MISRIAAITASVFAAALVTSAPAQAADLPCQIDRTWDSATFHCNAPWMNIECGGFTFYALNPSFVFKTSGTGNGVTLSCNDHPQQFGLLMNAWASDIQWGPTI